MRNMNTTEYLTTCRDLLGPTLLLTSDIIKQRLGTAALDRCVLQQEVVLFFCFFLALPP